MPQEIDQFLNTFLVPPTGQSPGQIKARLLYWIGVCNDPALFCADKSPGKVAAKRRSARQCLKRLAQRHQRIAADLMNEREVTA